MLRYRAVLPAVLLLIAGCASAPPKAPQAAAAPVNAAPPPPPATAAAPPAPAPAPAPEAPLPPLTAASAPPTPPPPPAPAAAPAPPPPLAIVIVDEQPHAASPPPPVPPAPRGRAAQHHRRQGQGQQHTQSGGGKVGQGKKGQRHAANNAPAQPQRPYHPDPGIIVDVANVQGTAVKDDVQKIARQKGYGVFRACYEEGLRRNQQLAGRVAVELTLGTDGSVQNARKASSTVGDDSVALCVTREASKLTLPSGTEQTAPSTLTLNVTLAVGDAPVPVQRAVPHADKIRETFRTKLPQVEACYQKGLDKKRDLGGRLALKLKVKPNGDIAEVGEWETHFADVDVTRCVLAVFRTMKLQRLGGRADHLMVYPLHFEATPKVSAERKTVPTEQVAVKPE